jgi:hypothetical protein
VDDADVARPPPLARLVGDAQELALGHRLVGVVLELGHGAPIVLVAHHAPEEERRAVFGRERVREDARGVERLGHDSCVAGRHLSPPQPAE